MTVNSSSPRMLISTLLLLSNNGRQHVFTNSFMRAAQFSTVHLSLNSSYERCRSPTLGIFCCQRRSVGSGLLHIRGVPSQTTKAEKSRQRLFLSNTQGADESSKEGSSISLEHKTVKTPPMFTSADITESIRCESEVEMSKVVDLISRVYTSHPPPSKEKTSKQHHQLSAAPANNVPSPTLLRTKDEYSLFVSSNNIQNYLFDCDGVLYRGMDPMPSASNVISSLIQNDKKVFFVTNNAASSRGELKNKLEKVLKLQKGMLNEDMMIGSAYVASRYLTSRLFEQPEENLSTIQRKGGASKKQRKPRVHVIGTSGLCKEIRSAGFDISGEQDTFTELDASKCGMSRDELASYPFTTELNGGILQDGGIDAVVIGLDNDFNYRKLCIATVLLQHNPDALLVATNLDAFDLVGSDARHLPGNGAIVRAVEISSGRTAINVGKPSNILADWILEEYGLKEEETIMVGDRLDTDVMFGNKNGMKSALVLTGCVGATDLEKLLQQPSIERDGMIEIDREQMIPSVIFPHIGYMEL